jgi:hypothetical protein
MAKRKRKSKCPQPQHKKSKKSQHDKHKRLQRKNSNRRKTTQAKVPLVGPMRDFVVMLQACLDRRNAFRLSIIIAGMFLTNGRCTASAWFVAAGVQDDWDRFYDCLTSVGRRSEQLATVVLQLVVHKFAPGLTDRITLGLDDSPTSRHGKQVEGAGVHHNPTPGPADGEWLYGHNWVALAWLAKHPAWGVIALPLRSLLYVREVDVPKLKDKYDWEFLTKHQLGVKLLTWFITTLNKLGVQPNVWLAVDGAYAARPFLLPVLELGIVVVSRLRKDACLFALPSDGSHGNRIYGQNKFNLAKRAGHHEGWKTLTYHCRGVEVTRQYKTFLATSRLISGPIRVVIIRFEDGGWAPYFCTDTSAEVCDILETVAARWAIEEHFHDVKEVWGAGQQQVRKVWSNLACWHLNQWMYTLVELCCWDLDKSELSDRSDRPWDNVARRPSHADRRRSISRKMLGRQFLAALPHGPKHRKLSKLFQDLMALAA